MLPGIDKVKNTFNLLKYNSLIAMCAILNENVYFIPFPIDEK